MRRAWAIPDSPMPRPSRVRRAQKPDLRSQGSRAACTSNTRFAHNKDVARRAPQKSDPPVSRRQAARAGNTRFAQSKDVARRAARARKNQIRPSKGGKRRARAIPDSPITRMSGARAKPSSARLKAIAGAHGQYPVRQ